MTRPGILVIAPHPDDETLGCGGTIRLRVEKGESVTVIFLTSGELGLKHLSPQKASAIREAEARRAGKTLGIASMHFLRLPDWVLGQQLRKAATALRPLLRALAPGIVYVPHPEDGHPDHQAAWPLLQQCWPDRRGAEPEVYGYEIWSPMPQPDCLVDISSVMARKIRALRAHRSQLGEFDYVRAITGLNQFRGSLGAKCKFAEAFRRLSLR